MLFIMYINIYVACLYILFSTTYPDTSDQRHKKNPHITGDLIILFSEEFYKFFGFEFVLILTTNYYLLTSVIILSPSSSSSRKNRLRQVCNNMFRLRDSSH